jgi:hypothetical protein
MEPHRQSPWFPGDAHEGRTSRTRGPIHPWVEPVVLLVRDRFTHPLSSVISRIPSLVSARDILAEATDKDLLFLVIGNGRYLKFVCMSTTKNIYYCRVLIISIQSWIA